MSKPAPIKPPKKFENTQEECDAALGYFLRAWDQIEASSGELFSKLSDTDIVTATIICASGIDQRTMRNILDALGKERLAPSDYSMLVRLLRRMRDATKTRNRLIHGHWRLNLLMEKVVPGDQPTATRAEFVRFYAPPDQSTIGKMAGRKPDQKLLAAHEFKLSRITQAATDAFALAREVRAFLSAAKLRPIRIPQPVF